MKRLLAIAALALAAGCVSVSEKVASLDEVGGDEVLVVGSIEIRPPVKAEEQSFKATDPFNMKRHFIGRALLFVDEKPEYRERTGHALNPVLEQTFFVKVPRGKRYVVKGSVTMAYALRVVSRRQAIDERTELLFPAPLELDLRPGDRAVYVGTLRLHRDEFHEVTRVEVRDDHTRAMADFRAQFPGAALPRKALLRVKGTAAARAD